MSPEKNHEEQHSPRSAELAGDIRVIMSVPKFLDRVAKPPTLEEWIDFICDYLPKEKQTLSHDSIKKILDQLGLLKNPKQAFRENFDYCYTLIPCSPNGAEWSTQDLMANQHLVRIEIPPEGQKRNEKQYRQQKWLFDFMPEEIRNECSFKAKYKNKETMLTPEKFLTGIVSDSARALLNLQRRLASK